MTASTDASRSPPVFPVLLVNFIGTLGYSIILPFLIFLVTRFQGNALVYGLLGATYPTFQLIGAPVLGRWSDVHGRKRVLLLSQLGTLVSWVLFCVALLLPVTVLLGSPEDPDGLVLTLPLAVLFVARALDGLTAATSRWPTPTWRTSPTRSTRSENFGKMAVSANLGFIVGPALAGLLGATAMGELLPVLAALGISVVGTAVIARLREPGPCPVDPGPPQGGSIRRLFGMESRECTRVRESHRLGAAGVLALEGVGYLLVIYFLVFLGFSFFYTAFPVHAAQGLAWTIPQTGAFFAVLSALMVAVQGPLLKRLSKRCSEGVLIVAGNGLLVGAFVLLSSRGLPAIGLGVVLFALGNGVMWPSVLAVLSKLAGDEQQGAVQGFAGGVGSLASVLGLVAGGLLYQSVGCLDLPGLRGDAAGRRPALAAPAEVGPARVRLSRGPRVAEPLRPSARMPARRRKVRKTGSRTVRMAYRSLWKG